jgi:N-acetylglutamate synthase-like GNAT family acetyltransferase
MASFVVRPAVESDVPAIAHIVHDAYASFIPLIGRAPSPMFQDYGALVAQGMVRVLLQDDTIIGISVVVPAANHLLLRTVAVVPSRQSSGNGRRLTAAAEQEARRLGFREIRVMIHVGMAKGIGFYRRLGYEEYERTEEDGYHRVLLRKRLG